MPKRVARLSDVAERAAVSQTTVVRVLRDNGYVATETRKKVLKAIDELGYQVNMVARSLKDRRTWVLGHIIPSLHPNPFFPRVAAGIDKTATELGYHVITCCAHQDAELEAKQVEMLLSRRVDGIIFTVPMAEENVGKVVEAATPCVMVERPRGRYPIDKILVDNATGVADAVGYLASLGHQNIGFIGADPIHPIEASRLNSFRQALATNGLNCNDIWIMARLNHAQTSGYRLAEEMISAGELPTAILVASDPMAVGVMQVLYEHRIRVPDDISIISYDDTLADQLAPPLTTIRQPMEDMGMVAVQAICERINGSNVPPKTIILDTTFTVRESTRCIGKPLLATKEGA